MQDGKKLLLNSFWSSSGWSYNDISDEVFQTCKAQGYMFDPPEIITHDEYMKSLVILYKQNGEVFEQQPIGHTDDDISFFDGMPDTEITFEKAE